MNESSRKRALDFLRVIATVIIVFHHYMQVSGKFPRCNFSFYDSDFYFGYLVEFFFVLSGFFTFGYIDKFDKGYKFKDFWIKRYLRFAPMLFATSMAYFLLHSVYSSLFNKPWLISYPKIWEVFLNTLGIQAGWLIDVGILNYVNYPLWYISVLLLCYLVFYLVTWFAIRSKLPRFTSYLFIFIVGVVIRICLILELFDFLPFLNAHSTRGFCGFFLGVLIGFILDKKKLDIKDYILIVSLPVIVCGLSFFVDLSFLYYNLLLFGFALIVLLFNNDHINNAMNFKILDILGSSTYYVYVWQVPLLLLIVILKNTSCTFIRLDSWLSMFMFTLLLFIVGVILDTIFKFINIHIAENFKIRSNKIKET